MRRSKKAVAVVGITVLTMLILADRSGSVVTEAAFVSVERADVHQTIPVFGQLTYQREKIISADVPGFTTQLCVKTGDRVNSRAALVRIDAPFAAEVAAVLAYGSKTLENRKENMTKNPQMQRVVRAEETCTVRQIFVEEGAAVAIGTPLMRVSSNEQRVICAVREKDAIRMTTGMWAWLNANGEKLGTAVVESIGSPRTDTKSGVAVCEVVLIPDKRLELSEYTIVDADVYLKGSDSVLSLPLQAITERGTVWWVNDGRCTEIPAQVVMSDEIRAWVCLPEGLTVAIGEFFEGQRVREVRP